MARLITICSLSVIYELIHAMSKYVPALNKGSFPYI